MLPPDETREGMRVFARTQPHPRIAYALMFIATVAGVAIWEGFLNDESMVDTQRKAESGDRPAQYKLATSFEISSSKNFAKACMWRTVISKSSQSNSAKWDEEHLNYACGKLTQSERQDATSKGEELARIIAKKR